MGNWGQREDVENDEDIAECARSVVMADGELSKRVGILQEVAQGCTLSPNVGKICINEIGTRGKMWRMIKILRNVREVL